MIRFFVNPLQLCQLMLDSGILESVNGADKFEDCSSKLFRFTIQQEDNVDDEVFADSSTLADFGTDSIFRWFFSPSSFQISLLLHLLQIILWPEV